MIAMIGCSCFILQAFLAYRIFVISERKWRVFPALSTTFALAGAVISLYLSVWFSKQYLTPSLTEKPVLVWAWFALE